MSNVFASAIFCVRNKDKVEQGDVGRLPVAIGQAKNVINSVYTIDNAIGRTAKTAVDALKIASEHEKLLEYAGKGVNFLSNNINNLIYVSAGLSVLTADDKPKALVQQGAAIGGMVLGESLMNKHLDKCFSSAAKKASEIKSLEKVVSKAKAITSTKWGKALPALIKGVTFVAGSIASYNLGKKIGDNLSEKIPPSGHNSEKSTQKDASKKCELKA